MSDCSSASRMSAASRSRSFFRLGKPSPTWRAKLSSRGGSSSSLISWMRTRQRQGLPARSGSPKSSGRESSISSSFPFSRPTSFSASPGRKTVASSRSWNSASFWSTRVRPSALMAISALSDVPPFQGAVHGLQVGVAMTELLDGLVHPLLGEDGDGVARDPHALVVTQLDRRAHGDGGLHDQRVGADHLHVRQLDGVDLLLRRWPRGRPRG